MIPYSIWCQTETQSNVQSSKIWIFREQVYNLLGSVTDWLLGSVSRLLGSILSLLGSAAIHPGFQGTCRSLLYEVREVTVKFVF